MKAIPKPVMLTQCPFYLQNEQCFWSTEYSKLIDGQGISGYTQYTLKMPLFHDRSASYGREMLCLRAMFVFSTSKKFSTQSQAFTTFVVKRHGSLAL